MNNKSFTLIELLVVIVIIGILAGVIMISTSSSIDKANIAKLKVFSESIKNDLMLNLVSEFKLDNNANDSWESNNGIMSGFSADPWRLESECISSECLNFNGTTSYLDIAKRQDYLPPHTIELWIKPDDFGTDNYGRQLFSFMGACTISDGYAFGLRPSGDIIIIPSDWQLDTNISSNNWHHIIFIWKNINSTQSEQTFHIDTVKYTRIINYLIPSNITASNIRIGIFQACWPTRFFKGNMDQIRIYDDALSSSQIKQNYIAGLNSLLSKESISKEDYNQRINELAYEK
jgi:prepilin-type N-terminal cleavage/methylation domain-containing protein